MRSGEPRQWRISHRKRLNSLGRGKVPEVGAKHRAKAPCTAGGAGGSGRREAAGAGRRGRGTRPLRAQAPGRMNTPLSVRSDGRGGKITPVLLNRGQTVRTPGTATAVGITIVK